MSTYPVDIKATTIQVLATHTMQVTAGPGRALGLFVSKEPGQAATRLL